MLVIIITVLPTRQPSQSIGDLPVLQALIFSEITLNAKGGAFLDKESPAEIRAETAFDTTWPGRRKPRTRLLPHTRRQALSCCWFAALLHNHDITSQAQFHRMEVQQNLDTARKERFLLVYKIPKAGHAVPSRSVTKPKLHLPTVSCTYKACTSPRRNLSELNVSETCSDSHCQRRYSDSQTSSATCSEWFIIKLFALEGSVLVKKNQLWFGLWCWRGFVVLLCLFLLFSTRPISLHSWIYPDLKHRLQRLPLS